MGRPILPLLTDLSPVLAVRDFYVDPYGKTGSVKSQVNNINVKNSICVEYKLGGRKLIIPYYESMTWKSQPSG